MSSPQYSVSWNAYQKNICNGLSALQQRGEFVDMTIAADGHHVKVHQMVMSLVSPYIQDLISSAACPHPVVFLKGVSYQTLQAILQYAYTGEVVVSNENIKDFFSACRELTIRGMEDATSADLSNDDAEADRTTRDTDWLSSRAPKKKVDNTVLRYNDDSTDLSQADNDATDITMESDTFNNDDDMVDSFDTSALKKGRPLLSQDEDSSVTRGTALTYSISRLGVIQAVLNRNIYFLRNPRKSGETLWRCLSYKRGRCPAYIVVSNNKLVKSVGTIQAVLNRNLYFMRNKRKNGDILWRCMSYQRQKCLACIVVRNNKVVTRSVTWVQYTVSYQGTLQLVLNRYIYCLQHRLKNGALHFRCYYLTNKVKCRAGVWVKDGKVIKRACAHNHPFHDAQILKRLRNRNMFASLNDVEGAIKRKRKQEGSCATVETLDACAE